jgi:chemotaxis family two-component system sensor kinase Cph1
MAQQASIAEVVTHLQRQRHQCLIYETDVEQFAATVPYLKQGLAAGEYCFYIVDEHTAEAAQTAMYQLGIDVDGAVKRGQLVLLTKQETYLRNARFNPDDMMEFVKDACRRAIAAGFAGIRGTGEMSWHLGSGATLDELLLYESRLNDEIFPHFPVTGICQYNLNRFSGDFLRGILETHPVVIYKDVVSENYFYIPRQEFLAERTDTRAQVLRRLKTIRESAEQRRQLLAALEAGKKSAGQALDRLAELERFQEVTVGRELRMMALEKENVSLRKQLAERDEKTTGHA